MAEWRITTQKSNIPAINKSEIFGDFSMVWDTTKTDEFINSFKFMMENTIRAASDTDQETRNEVLEKIKGIKTAGDVENIKEKGWITWVKKD